MSEPCTQKVYAYWRECDHLTLDLGGSCHVCAKIETRVKAARVEGMKTARLKIQDALVPYDPLIGSGTPQIYPDGLQFAISLIDKLIEAK